MKLSNSAINQLVPFVVGDNHEPYRTGTQLLELFNEYGGYDYLPSNGLPFMPNSYLRYSRKVFAEQKMAEMNDTEGLKALLEHIIKVSESTTAQKSIGVILSKEGYSITIDDEVNIISDGIIDNNPPVATEAYFHNLEKQVLEALDEAKVSICVAMAWFTNEKIKEKLLEKKAAGVDIDIVVYDDGVNKKHGVDLSDLPHIFVKGSKSGIMHHKFCIIDNQRVLSGSYNWTNNAETRNDENVTILIDPNRASDFSVEFKKLKNP